MSTGASPATAGMRMLPTPSMVASITSPGFRKPVRVLVGSVSGNRRGLLGALRSRAASGSQSAARRDRSAPEEAQGPQSPANDSGATARPLSGGRHLAGITADVPGRDLAPSMRRLPRNVPGSALLPRVRRNGRRASGPVRRFGSVDPLLLTGDCNRGGTGYEPEIELVDETCRRSRCAETGRARAEPLNGARRNVRPLVHRMASRLLRAH
jgi:hypothetical protein